MNTTTNYFNEQHFISSYNNISFSPERRGAQDCQYFTDLLNDDLKELGENQGNYQKKFIDKVMLWVNRQSRTASSFITGPANFPVSRNQKRMDSTQNAWNEFWHWREKYFKAVNRERTKSPEEEIDAAIKDISMLIDKKEQRKELIKKVKNIFNDDNELIKLLESEGFNQDEISNMIRSKGYYLSLGGYCSSLTTKIRERKKKIEAMKQRIENKNNFKDMVFPGGKITIENDRVVIYHDEKPEREIITQIKKSGFRYSPKFTCWVRKHTYNALRDAVYLYKNVLSNEVKSNEG